MGKILFNMSVCQPIGKSKFHGGGKYGYIVFRKLLELAPDKVAVYYDDRSFIEKDILKLINKNNINQYFAKEINIYEAARNESNIVYTPLFNFNGKSFPPSDVTLIETQHGIRQLEMPGDSSEWRYITSFFGLFRFLKHKIIRIKSSQIARLSEIVKAQNIHFVTVSEHSKYALASFLPNLSYKSVKVFYSPSTIDDSIDTSSFVNCYGKYYLLLGVNRWIKNNIRAIQALDSLFTERPDLKGVVVATGIKSWKEINFKVKNKGRFFLLGYVDEVTLKALYRNAYLFVYPSLNEGFGYPPLEAMHEGCPVIASSIASIPEVCGDAVTYFNPYCIDEIKNRILQMEDIHFRDLMIKRGISREHIIHEKQNQDLDELCDFLLNFINN